MAEYKRKKVKMRKVAAPKPIKNKVTKQKQPTEKIKMKSTAKTNVKKAPAKTVKKTSNTKFKVLKGFKRKRTFKTTVVGIVSLIVILTVSITALCVPVNIFEATGNFIASIGSESKYPISLSSGVTLDVKTNGNIIYILSDTNVDIFNTSGKHIESIQHGYENPAMKISDGRSIVYDIGSVNYSVFNLMGVIQKGETKNEIIAANISRSGAIAVATKSNTHTSEVQVLGKDGYSKYTWYCSTGTITNVALSSNGKRVAVGILSTENGSFKSKVNVLEFDSATASYTYEYDGLIYSLETMTASKFCVTTEQSTDYCSYNGKAPVSVKYEYPVSTLKYEYGNYISVDSRRAGDKTENNIYLLNKSAKQKILVAFEGALIDFDVNNGYIYCLSNSEVVKIDKNGKVVAKSDCGFSALKVIGNGSYAIIITDNSFYRIKF